MSHWYSVKYLRCTTSYCDIGILSSCTSRFRGIWKVPAGCFPFAWWLFPFLRSFLPLPDFSFGTPASDRSSSSVGWRYRRRLEKNERRFVYAIIIIIFSSCAEEKKRSTHPVEQRIHRASEKWGLTFCMMLTKIRVITSCAPSSA